MSRPTAIRASTRCTSRPTSSRHSTGSAWSSRRTARRSTATSASSSSASSSSGSWPAVPRGHRRADHRPARARLDGLRRHPGGRPGARRSSGRGLRATATPTTPARARAIRTRPCTRPTAACGRPSTDLARWLVAQTWQADTDQPGVDGGSWLEPRSAEMHRPHIAWTGNPWTIAQGLSFYTVRRDETDWSGHAGAVEGFGSKAQLSIADGVGVIVVLNTMGDAGALASDLGKLVLPPIGRPPPRPGPSARRRPCPTPGAPWSGTYRWPPYGDGVRIEVRGARPRHVRRGRRGPRTSPRADRRPARVHRRRRPLGRRARPLPRRRLTVGSTRSTSRATR